MKSRKARQKWGLRQAARALDVNPGHLSRVLRGLRESVSLLASYRELIKTKPPVNSPRFPISDPAPIPPSGNVHHAWKDNYTSEWAAVVHKLGFSIAVVHITPDWSNPGEAEIGIMVGDELRNAGMGHLDSTQWQPSPRHFFYIDASRMADALTLIKTTLQRRGVLARSEIAHSDKEEKFLRLFYPTQNS